MSAATSDRNNGAPAPPLEGPANIALAAAPVAVPVPPSPMERGVVKAVNELISELAPLAAAPRLTRAPEALVAFVPPRATANVPLLILFAFVASVVAEVASEAPLVLVHVIAL